MHTLLQQMGRDIVKEKTKKIGERQFLVDTEDISELLEDEDNGTGEILGIKLDEHCREEDIQISKSAFQGMKNLQFLRVSSKVRIPEGLSCLPNKLRLLEWKYYPLTFLPSKFSCKFLVELIITESKLEKLWDGIKPLQRLKRMDLSKSRYLKEIPDLTNATRLEELDLQGCESFLELTITIGYATKFKRCSAIWKVPSSIKSNWSRLRKLDMSGCICLKEFPVVPDSIEELVLCNTWIEEIPPWIENLSHLGSLTMYGCRNLKKISPNVSKLENLYFLGLRNNGESENDPLDFHEDPEIYVATFAWGDTDVYPWRRLISDLEADYLLPICLNEKVISLSLASYGRLYTIPDCIRLLSGLTELNVYECLSLEALPPLPDSLLFVDAEDCVCLERIDSSVQNPNICLNFSGCERLNQNAKELIYTSCKHALLPGEEVPAHFPYQAASGSLRINLTSGPLPSSLRFKACIFLSTGSTSNYKIGVSCHVIGKQNGLTIQYGSNQHHMEFRSGGYGAKGNYMYIFEDSFSLNQNFPEAGEATLSDLVFEFISNDTNVEVKACGVRLLEDEEESRRDEDEDDEVGDDDNDGVEEDIKDDVDNSSLCFGRGG